MEVSEINVTGVQKTLVAFAVEEGGGGTKSNPTAPSYRTYAAPIVFDRDRPEGLLVTDGRGPMGRLSMAKSRPSPRGEKRGVSTKPCGFSARRGRELMHLRRARCAEGGT